MLVGTERDLSAKWYLRCVRRDYRRLWQAHLLDCSVPVTSASVKACVAATEAPARRQTNYNVAWQALDPR